MSKDDRFIKRIVICDENWLVKRQLPESVVMTKDRFKLKALSRVWWNYEGSVNQKRVLLHDNARPHTAQVTRDEIKTLDDIELLPHSEFSPDLVPSDYYLFRSIVIFFRKKKLSPKEMLKMQCGTLFPLKPRK
ncbi:Mariner Mos1 transposase [Eumeta japonica]|uniref:Mariner Mos1 transposase n=1 Tax=Eumeta variegata TaxID=151549 RepID=A0A4C1WTR2_EUMVA|nr:Mariner Mos1 transposase [Eumeta japonica]